ncbi:MAG: hypothetical protein P1U68_16700 [Verrucomicrobiales bacterium]|nr:hypothetical protein [Verrucomicrobiales bacterium]
MKFLRFSTCSLLLGLSAFPVFSFSADTEAKVSSIIEQFSTIEDRLHTLKTVTIDASHADSIYGVGKLTVWIDGESVVKVKNELNSDDTVNIQEAWISNQNLIFFFERLEWHGNQDGAVTINEYRYYFDDEKAVREMSRNDLRAAGQSLDVSDVAHQVSDDYDPDYAKSLYDERKTQTGEFLRTALAFSSHAGGTPDLKNWPYRVLLQTLSPNGQYALAWGLEGVSTPDWSRWETERYDYLTALGDPAYTLDLIMLSTGSSLGRMKIDFEPGGSAPYLWTKWSEDGRLFVGASDYRWATGTASLYQLNQGSVREVANLSGALSDLAIEALKQAEHPYAIDSTEAMGFIDLKHLGSDGSMEIGYAIESKFEGTRRNASIDFELQADLSTGDLKSLSSRVGDFTPLPTSWSKLKTFLAGKASGWLTHSPAVEDYLSLNTFIDDGILHLYNSFGGFFNQDLIEIITQRPLFTSGPHYPGGIMTDSRFEFGHYDPESIRTINQGMGNVLGPDFVDATRGLYNAEFSSMAKHFQEALHYWHANPQELERQKNAYLAHLKSETLPENYYLLEGDLARELMESYSSDWTEQTCYLTGLRFWVRRSCDGSYAQFASLLQEVIANYDRGYFAYRGIPTLRLPSGNEEGTPGITEAIMDESGAMGINQNTPFELAALQAKLPGMIVTYTDFYDEGGQYPAFQVAKGNTNALTLIRYDPGDPLAFEARSGNIRMRNGISTGDTFGSIFETQVPLGLFNGLETDVGAVMVEAPGSERITLMFEPPPGRQITDLNLKRADLNDFVLFEMRWMP